MKTYKIKTEKVVTQEQIDDVVSTALDGGISYWCDSAVTTGDLEYDNHLSDMLTRGAAISLHVRDDDEWHDLILEELLKVLGEMNFDFNNYDTIDVDIAVQKAIFGEVIYG